MVLNQNCQTVVRDSSVVRRQRNLGLVKQKHEYEHMCPKLTRIAELVLTIPVSNVWPERGASKVKIIKTDLRNRLKNDMLEGLMHLTVIGPDICTDQCVT